MWRGNKLTFYHFAGACAFLYVSAQAFQEIVFVLYGDHEENFEASILQRLNGADQARALILLISFFGLLVVFSAITMRCSRRTPGPSVFGLVCGCLWITAELFYRTVDLFLVTKVWASEYQRIGAGSQQTAIGQWIHNWDQFVWAWYFVLLAGVFRFVDLAGAGGPRHSKNGQHHVHPFLCQRRPDAWTVVGRVRRPELAQRIQ